MTERARVAVAGVWMQLLKLRRLATSQGRKYEVLCGGMKQITTLGESGLHGGQGALAGVDAGHVPEKDPRLSFLARFITSFRVAVSCRIVVVVALPFSDVTL